MVAGQKALVSFFRVFKDLQSRKPVVKLSSLNLAIALSGWLQDYVRRKGGNRDGGTSV